MSSIKKIEANRRDGRSSTGPRPPEGKIAVFTDAIAHGLRGTKHLLYCQSIQGPRSIAAPARYNVVDTELG